MSNKGRQRGSAFEYKIKNALGGRIYTGQDGDVEARGFRIECKYRTAFRLESPGTLADWVAQIERYAVQNPDLDFALAFGGGGRGKLRNWVAVPLLKFEEMTSRLQMLDDLADFVYVYEDAVEEIEKLGMAMAMHILEKRKDA
jgi:hypothetical protein